MFYQITLNRHCFLYISPLLMVKNDVLLLLHPSKWHVEEQGRIKTKKYYHQVRGPVWLLPANGTTPHPSNPLLLPITIGHNGFLSFTPVCPSGRSNEKSIKSKINMLENYIFQVKVGPAWTQPVWENAAAMKWLQAVQSLTLWKCFILIIWPPSEPRSRYLDLGLQKG